ncbi:MAG: hypothetical protein JNK01_23455, partial [Devosia sp.]|nr:hypothetical protein [Devosia sp.]
STDPLSVTGLNDDKLGDILANGSFLGGDSNGNDLLDVGETWTYEITAEDVVLDADETLVNEVTATGVDDEGNEDSDTDTETVTGTDVLPDIKVVKSASVTSINEGTATDIVYTYAVTNESTTSTDALDISSLYDDKLGELIGKYESGDTNDDGLLDKGETWIFKATAAAVVADVGDSIVNEVTVTATDEEDNEVSDNDTATVTVANVAASIAIAKTVDANGDNVFSELETVQAFGDSVTYRYELTNTGASTDPLTLDDLIDDMGKFADVNLVVNGVVQAGVTIEKSGGDNDALLEVGETWTLKYTTNVNLNPGEKLTNTATVSAVDDEGGTATASDTAAVQALSGPGVRTPGFWTNLGKQFWDGIGNNQTKSGPNFAASELAYDIDYNNDGVKDGKAGLLIGDYNRNGLTDVGEDTFFISYADALKIIDASAKDQQDTRFVLARDAVATWLNFLAGNPIGDAATDPNSPQHYLNEAIDWLQVTNGGNAGSTWENWGGGSAVKAGGNTIWNNASNTDSSLAGNELSGNTIHSELDFFNNTGMTFLGVNTFVYANDGG